MKKLLKVLPVVMVVCLAVTSVFAYVDTGMPNTSGSGSVTTLDNAVGSVWNTVLTICRIVAIAAIIIAGLRYMFASADQKADIKKSMGILAIGAILVFGGSFVVEFIVKAANEVVT